MDNKTTFGKDPERLKRLLSVGLEEEDKRKKAATTASLEQCTMQKQHSKKLASKSKEKSVGESLSQLPIIREFQREECKRGDETVSKQKTQRSKKHCN